MTRQEFLTDVNDFWDLRNFCYDEDCDILIDAYDYDSADEVIQEGLTDYIRNYNDDWRDIRDRLNYIDLGGDWFWCNGWDDWDCIDDDFDDYKEQVLDWADRNGVFDEEDAEDVESSEPEEEPPFDTEDFSVLETLDAGSSALRSIRSDEEKRMDISPLLF